MTTLVCYHGHEGCHWCGTWHLRQPVQHRGRPKPRCPACGRFVRLVAECARCVARGFVALRLFDIDAYEVAA